MIACFDCFSGASGDMILAALIDAGADARGINKELAKVAPGLSLSEAATQKHGLASTSVSIDQPDDFSASTFSGLSSLLERSELDGPVKRRAMSILARLAAAEASVHGALIRDVHFHEIAGADTVADIVGVSAALEQLGITRCYASAVATGTGTVDTEHGTLPLPAPAVLELLTGAPMRYLPIDAELITPTGAAILAETCEFGAPPSMVISSTGYGAGTRDLPDRSNVVRVTLGAEIGRATPGDQLDKAIVIEATIDDMNPEILAYAMERLLGAGALDVWMTPAIGKKGRQATVLSVVSAEDRADALRKVILAETSTLGVRSYAVDRMMLDRKMVEVEVLGHRVGVKVGILSGAPVNVAPEYADCADVAMKTEEPLKRVYQLALEAYTALNKG